MQRIAPLFHGNQPIKPRHPPKYAFRHPPADNGEARFRMRPHQVIKQARGQHSIANTGGGDEKNAHLAALPLPVREGEVAVAPLPTQV